jgi:hypothetical protein
MIKHRGKWTAYVPVRAWVKRRPDWPALRATLGRMMDEALERKIGEMA